uniref:G_PROTEIN_RECEP_F3_4 domain-containing protein n=1 Tax=Soboliphyme baturini TaxID=241478 RepID=A0A183IBN9_9BILA
LFQIIAEFFTPQNVTCCLIVWFRHLGFTVFYGCIVLKIYRNLSELRARRAHHVVVREKDQLKYLCYMIAFTLSGLSAWTMTSVEANSLERPFGSTTSLLTTVGYSSDELVVSSMTRAARFHTWLSSSPNTLMLLSFIQVHLTVTVTVAVIIFSKLYHASVEQNKRSSSFSFCPSKAHPSLAKLRDNLVNGTVDFAEVPIAEMNPDDIRAELKRVYTQLRMLKLTNVYLDNPHIMKRKGCKKTSNKQAQYKRTSLGTSVIPNETKRYVVSVRAFTTVSRFPKGVQPPHSSVCDINFLPR